MVTESSLVEIKEDQTKKNMYCGKNPGLLLLSGSQPKKKKKRYFFHICVGKQIVRGDMTYRAFDTTLPLEPWVYYYDNCLYLITSVSKENNKRYK